ncbi:hypothetical protein TSAR_009026 [Trichomalopsis sarcophagae]|uniref:Uncharacterized protein n=1 Tax=Trichomalopsis sarcophagae TaxID=543379 RepID=A0A232EGP2_9HYME|nr:hypothetical protein TSAR_009026 [Trichomalopsis sarcophagae]
MKEEWRKYDPTGKLFPKGNGQSSVPILIEFPSDLYAQSRNSYYKKLRTVIKILGLLALL